MASRSAPPASSAPALAPWLPQHGTQRSGHAVGRAAARVHAIVDGRGPIAAGTLTLRAISRVSVSVWLGLAAHGPRGRRLAGTLTACRTGQRQLVRAARRRDGGPGRWREQFQSRWPASS